MMTQKKIKLIANPVAGGNADGRIEKARAFFERQGCEVDLTLTGARGDASSSAKKAKEAGFDLIVAAGGDGTLNEVVGGLTPCEIPVAFLPMGTTNVFALEVGLPFDIEKACRIALEGVPRKVCVGRAGEDRFLLMAGIGFDAEVVYRVDTRLKRWTGKFAYLVSAISCLASRPPAPVEILCEDGSVHTGYGAIIGNGRLYGGRFSLTPGASLTEDALEVCLLLKGGRLQLLRYALSMVLGKPPSPALLFKTKALTVRGGEIPVQVDGDYLGKLPMKFEADFGAVTLVFPPAP